VVIVVTDGKASRNNEPGAEAMLLQGANVNMFAVGVGRGLDPAELRDIASEPDSKHVSLCRGREGNRPC